MSGAGSTVDIAPTSHDAIYGQARLDRFCPTTSWSSSVSSPSSFVARLNLTRSFPQLVNSRRIFEAWMRSKPCLPLGMDLVVAAWYWRCSQPLKLPRPNGVVVTAKYNFVEKWEWVVPRTCHLDLWSYMIKKKEKKNETDADSLRYMASENNLTHVTSSIASGTAINQRTQMIG